MALARIVEVARDPFECHHSLLPRRGSLGERVQVLPVVPRDAVFVAATETEGCSRDRHYSDSFSIVRNFAARGGEVREEAGW